MSWIRHNRQLFDWQIMPTYVPSGYTLDSTSLYGHLKGIDLMLAALEAHRTALAAVAQSGQYADLIGAPDPAAYYTKEAVDQKLDDILLDNALPIHGGTVDGELSLQQSGFYIRVTGAGTALANGVYEHDGVETTGTPSNPKPVYRKIGAPHILIQYLSYPSSPFIAWYIVNEQAQLYYYAAPGNVPTPDFAIGWTLWSGVAPLPTVQALTTFLSPKRVDAYEFHTGSRLYFPAGDHLHGNGIDLLYTKANGDVVVLGVAGEGGGLSTAHFEDTDSVYWEIVAGKLRAHADVPAANGTTLRKAGVNLTGTYNLGPQLVVNGDEIQVAIDTSAFLQVGGTPESGKAPVFAGAPYNAANWRHVANFPTLPSSGEPQALWWHPTNQEFFLAQPYAYSQAPSDPNDVQIGDGIAIFGDIGEHAFVVPPGVTMLQVKGWGQAGGNHTTASRGGFGGHVQGFLAVTPGEVLQLIVPGHTGGMTYSEGGIGGGGSSLSATVAAGGGGAAMLWRGGETPPSVTLSNLIAVAAGGGGAHGANVGGGGGGLTGGDGSSAATGGGTQSGGGIGSDPGAYLQGGDSAGTGSRSAGGGGYHGGGGGGSANSSGGGGSSYIGALLFAITFTGPFTEDSDYQAGWAQRSGSTYAPGGQGGWVLRW